MPISLYDLSVGSYLQTLPAVAAFMKKGAEHFAANGVALDEIVKASIHPDMLPFWFQIESTCHHAAGTLAAMKSGEFSPPKGAGKAMDYAGLQTMVDEALATLKAATPDEVNAAEGGNITFKMGTLALPFTVPNFVLSFSLPNFNFHAATAYDILRMKGVPLGKRDFMGALRITR
jgi:hypothetical protein